VWAESGWGVTEQGPRWQLGLGRENGLMFWAIIALEASFAAYFTFLPLYVAQLGANPAQVGLVMGFWGISRLFFLVPSGMLIDRFPSVPLIVITRSIGVAGLLLAVVVPTWWLLPVALILTSAANIAFPAISSLIAGAATDAGRARAFTLIYTVGPAVSTVVMPLVGGEIAQAVSLRMTPLIAAGCAACSIVLFARLRPAPRQKKEGEIPATYRDVIAYAPVRNLCALMAVTLVGMTVGTTLMPNFLRDVHGLDYGRIGQLGSVAAVGSIILGLAFGRIKPFSRPLTGITIAVGCTAATFAVLLGAASLPLFALAYLLRGGYMVAWSLFSAALGDVTPPRLYGRTFAVGEICGGLGMAFAPLLAGPLYNWQPRAPLVAGLLICVPVVALLGAVAYRKAHERVGVANEELSVA
jgi:MFS family permease